MFSWLSSLGTTRPNPTAEGSAAEAGAGATGAIPEAGAGGARLGANVGAGAETELPHESAAPAAASATADTPPASAPGSISVPSADAAAGDCGAPPPAAPPRGESRLPQVSRQTCVEALAVLLLPPALACALAFLSGRLLAERTVEVHFRMDIDLRAAALLSTLLFWVFLLPPCYRRSSIRWPAKDAGVAAPVEATPCEDIGGENAGAAEAEVVDVKREERGVQVEELPEPEERGLPEDVLRSLALWRFRQGDFDVQKRQAEEKVRMDRLFDEMLGTCPALVHRFPAVQPGQHAESSWSSPIFSACGRLWTVRSGLLASSGTGEPGSASTPTTGVNGSSTGRYFCVLPHGHTERLHCSLLFARRPGEGYREREIHNWPSDLAGHPWGPTITASELESYLQDDGSVLIMIHVVGLVDAGSKRSSGQS